MVGSGDCWKQAWQSSGHTSAEFPVVGEAFYCDAACVTNRKDAAPYPQHGPLSSHYRSIRRIAMNG